MTLKEIKDTQAIDITNLKFKDANNLKEKEKGFTTISISHGLYGMNGAIIQGNKTKKTYKIQARNATLFLLI